jgi:hypothetical protein
MCSQQWASLGQGGGVSVAISAFFNSRIISSEVVSLCFCFLLASLPLAVGALFCYCFFESA